MHGLWLASLLTKTTTYLNPTHSTSEHFPLLYFVRLLHSVYKGAWQGMTISLP